jgi:hypothetical protein
LPQAPRSCIARHLAVLKDLIARTFTADGCSCCRGRAWVGGVGVVVLPTESSAKTLADARASSEPRRSDCPQDGRRGRLPEEYCQAFKYVLRPSLHQRKYRWACEPVKSWCSYTV